MSLTGRLDKKAGIRIENGSMIFDGPMIANGGFLGSIGKGNLYFVDGVNGNDARNGKTPQTALLTLSAAYSKLVAEQHDTVVLIGGDSSVAITDQVVWAKDYCHLIGMAAPTPNSRAKLTNSGNSSASKALLEVTASGCMFSNFRIFQGSAVATVGAIEVSGDRNYFNNVDIQGQGHATAAGGANAYSLFLNGAEECRFNQCTIGLDTVVRTDGSPLRLDGSSARNEFIDCLFRSACETAAKAFVKYVDTAAVDRSLLFKDCVFYNFWANHGGTLNEVFTIPASPLTHDVILHNCSSIGSAQWAANDRGTIWVVGGTPAAGTAGSGSTGIGVEPS